MKILFVCLGNICRSPLAEGIMRHKVNAKGLKWEIDSAGTGHWHVGEAPDPRSVSTAQKYGVDIQQQRARQFKPADFDLFDRIYAMDRSNLSNILRLASSGDEMQKVELIMNRVYPGADKDVPDPYWDNDGFETVFRMLDQACEKIVEELQ